MEKPFRRRDLLGIRDLTAAEIVGILDKAVNISVSSSSVSKGETLLDTAMNLDAMAPDCIVVRHSSAGVPHQLAKVSRAAVVNAGVGANEHPTQALLDAMTIREHKKT